MARKSTKTKIPNETLLSEEEVKQVWDFYQFASAYQSSGAITPILLNERMKDTTLNPLAPTQAALDEALLHPKESEEALMGISEHFEIVSQPYKRLLSYLSSMLAFDLTYTATNADKDDYRTNAFKKDEKALEDYFDRFDYKARFTTVVKELLRNETYFGCPRFTGEKYILQELPSTPTYTKVTGRFSHGLLGSFNMYYFLLPGVDINMYPKFFKDKYDTIWGSKSGNQQYIPSISPELRGVSSWVYWQDVPPDIMWVWKMSPEIATRVPYFTGLFSDLILQALMRNLQKNVNMAVASRMILGSVPYLKDAGTKVSNALAISPENLAKFLQLVKSALNEAVKVSAAPLENMNAINFSSDNELYPQFLKNMLASSGINTGLIFTSDVRPNQMESQLSLNTDEQLMTILYPQFDSYLDYHANKVTKKFKFSFKFEGTEFFTNRAERLKKQQDLLSTGIVLPKKISAAIGMRYQDFRKQMEEAKSLGFVENLTPVIQASQLSGKEGQGRPQTEDSELSDSGAQTREAGSNLTRRVSSKK